MIPQLSVQVSGIDPETPYQQIQALLAGQDSESEEIGGDKDPLIVDTLRIDRTAIIKFKKAKDVSDISLLPDPNHRFPFILCLDTSCCLLPISA